MASWPIIVQRLDKIQNRKAGKVMGPDKIIRLQDDLRSLFRKSWLRSRDHTVVPLFLQIKFSAFSSVKH